uniref:Uncharacterized protein n=1 Tax=Sus scrofa TaxID=9823 RepID=A0A8D1VCW3_PIG
LLLRVPLLLCKLQLRKGPRLDSDPPQRRVGVTVRESRLHKVRAACPDRACAPARGCALPHSLGTCSGQTPGIIGWVGNRSLNKAGTQICFRLSGLRFRHDSRYFVVWFPSQGTISSFLQLPRTDHEGRAWVHNASPERRATGALLLAEGAQRGEDVTGLTGGLLQRPQAPEEPQVQLGWRWPQPDLGCPWPPHSLTPVSTSLHGSHHAPRQSLPTLQGSQPPGPQASCESPPTQSGESPPPTASHSAQSPAPRRGASSTDPCHPQQISALGSLDVLPSRVAGPGGAVPWLGAPGTLVTQKTLKAGSKVWVLASSEPRTECQIRGWFCCKDPEGKLSLMPNTPLLCSKPSRAPTSLGSPVLEFMLLLFLGLYLWHICRPSS